MSTTPATARQISYIESLVWKLDIDNNAPTTQASLLESGASRYVSARNRAKAGMEFEIGFDLEYVPGLDPKEFAVTYRDAANAWIESRNIEAREILARIDDLTKAEASHLIDLLKN